MCTFRDHAVTALAEPIRSHCVFYKIFIYILLDISHENVLKCHELMYLVHKYAALIKATVTKDNHVQEYGSLNNAEWLIMIHQTYTVSSNLPFEQIPKKSAYILFRFKS